MAKSYSDFKLKYLGKSVDVDGFPAGNIYQCWDLVSGLYFPYIGGKTIHCGGKNGTGYVIDIATQRKTNGILDFCIDIGLKAELQPGDICVWKECAACPKSHIAIYDHDNGQNAVYFLGQNQPYNFVNVYKIDVSGIVGVFRPKIFVKIKPTKPADQVLTVGSKVKSYGFYVERLKYKSGQWMLYNSWVGGWIPTKHVSEVDSRDGKKDNILHVGSGVALDGTLTVSKIDVKNNRAYLKELGYWVYSRCLNEVKDA